MGAKIAKQEGYNRRDEWELQLEESEVNSKGKQNKMRGAMREKIRKSKVGE